MTESSFHRILQWLDEAGGFGLWVSNHMGKIIWISESFKKFAQIEKNELLHDVSGVLLTQDKKIPLRAVFENLPPWGNVEFRGQLALREKISQTATFKFLKFKTEWTGNHKLLGFTVHQDINPEFYLEFVLRNTSNGIFTTDEHSIIAFWSKSAERIYGFSAEFAVGKVWTDLLNVQFVGIDSAVAIKQLQETGFLRAQTIQKRQDGGSINVEVNCLAIYNEKGEIKGIVSINPQVTSGLNTKLHLTNEESIFLHLFENANDIFYRFNLLPSPHFSYINPPAERITGYTVEEYYADPKLGLKLFHLEEQHLRNNLFQQKPGEIIRPIVLRCKHKDGNVIYIEQQNIPIFDKEGILIAIEGTARDITEQIRTEQERKLNQRLLEEAALTGNFGGWNYEVDIDCFTWSPQLFDIYELPAEREEKGMKVMQKLYSPKSLEELLNKFEEAKIEGKSFKLETEINTWKNHKKWVRITGRPILEEGRVIRISGTVQDITQQKKTEEQLKDSKKKLRRLYQKTQGILELERKKISHELHDELGQLLTVINLDLRSLMKKTRSPGIRTMAGQMKSAIESAVEIVRRVSGELHPPLLDQMGLVPAIQWLLSQLSRRTKININAQLPEIFEIPLEYPHSIHIYRIVQESFTNILRHSEATEASLILKREGNELYLKIEDNGKGFNLEEQEETIHAGIAGMYDRADIMGGTLKIETSSGKGTFLFLKIPL